MNKLKISVITAVYNGSAFLPALIESILQQDYTNFEHLIINDGSTDDGKTEEVLKGYPHLKWWSTENRGQYAAQNELLDKATGEIVLIICADDEIASPDVFSRVTALWQAKPELSMIYGRVSNMEEDGSDSLGVRGPQKQFSRWFMRQVMVIPHHCTYVKRDIIASNKIYYDPAFVYRGDWDWFLRYIDAVDGWEFIDYPFAKYRIHAVQKTESGQLERIRAEERKVCQKNGLSFTIYLILRHYLDTRIRIASLLNYIKAYGFAATVSKIWSKISGRNIE
jgi:glycosyltransferase involved in cell wall biosynthesis